VLVIKPVENDILDEEKSVNKEKMASYAEIVKDDGKENESSHRLLIQNKLKLFSGVLT
jgi:hypothetical protein